MLCWPHPSSFCSRPDTTKSNMGGIFPVGWTARQVFGWYGFCGRWKRSRSEDWDGQSSEKSWRAGYQGRQAAWTAVLPGKYEDKHWNVFSSRVLHIYIIVTTYPQSRGHLKYFEHQRTHCLGCCLACQVEMVASSSFDFLAFWTLSSLKELATHRSC